jgi:hypothetical protein
MAQATVNLNLNAASFEAGLNQAQRRAQSFETQVAGFFKRDPTHRAERAFSALATGLSTGSVAAGVSTFAASLSGLGLLAGVAIGTAIGVFEKFRGEIAATDQATRKLGNQLALLGGTGGPEKLEAQFESVLATTEDLIQKSATMGNRLSNFLDKTINPLLGTSSRGRGADQSNLITAGLQAAGKLLSQRADAEEGILNIQRESLSVSSSQAKLSELELRNEIKKNAILEEGKKLKLEAFEAVSKGQLKPEQRDNLIREIEATTKRRLAISDIETQQLETAENEKARIRATGLAMALEEANIEKAGAAVGDQKINQLKNQLELLNLQLTATKNLTAEEKASLQVQVAKTQAQLRQEQFQRVMHPGEWQQEQVQAAIQRERMKAVLPEGWEGPAYPGAAPYRDISGNIVPSPAYQTSPQAYGQTGGLPGKGPATDPVVQAIQDLKQTITNIWQ